MENYRIALLAAAASVAAPTWAQKDAKGPHYAPSGYDVGAVDRSTRPGDDFFQYANGRYLGRAIIPADRPAVSRRLEMTDRMEGQLHGLLEDVSRDVGEQPADVRGKAGAFYYSFVDEATIDRRGAAAIAPELDAIRSASSPSDLAALMGRSADGFYPAIVAP